MIILGWALIVAAQAGYHSYLEGVAAGLPPHELFACFNRFRVLCAHRLDVTALNEALGAAGNSAAVPVGSPWLPECPLGSTKDGQGQG